MRNPRQHGRHRTLLSLATLLGLALAPAVAFAQDGGQPDAEELRRRVRQVDRLMGEAEESLARSLDSKDARERSERVAKILETKAKEETGKSAADLRAEAAAGSTEAKATLDRLAKDALVEALGASDEVRRLLDSKAREESGDTAEALRKLAEGGSKEAAETLQRLIGEATQEALQKALGAGETLKKILEEAAGGEGGGSGGASKGLKQMLEGGRKQGKGVSEGIEWILENATSKGGKKPKPKEPKHDPKAEKPPEETQPPQDPKMEKWLATLPPQLRKAYETEDWDSIPPKWRDILRVWTKKMADELEAGRRK